MLVKRSWFEELKLFRSAYSSTAATQLISIHNTSQPTESTGALVQNGRLLSRKIPSLKHTPIENKLSNLKHIPDRLLSRRKEKNYNKFEDMNFVLTRLLALLRAFYSQNKETNYTILILFWLI